MKSISGPNEAQEHLKSLARKKVEEIWTLALGPRLELLGLDRTFKGTSDRCLFHPREVFHFAIKKRASSLLLAHNHPTGPTFPSREDWAVTRRMIFLGQMMQIPLVDHVIVSPKELYSFRRYHKDMFERMENIESVSDRELGAIAGASLTEPWSLKSRGRGLVGCAELPSP